MKQYYRVLGSWSALKVFFYTETLHLRSTGEIKVKSWIIPRNIHFKDESQCLTWNPIPSNIEGWIPKPHLATKTNKTGFRCLFLNWQQRNIVHLCAEPTKKRQKYIKTKNTKKQRQKNENRKSKTRQKETKIKNRPRFNGIKSDLMA